MEASKRHEVGDRIQMKNGDYRMCVCANEYTAVFAHCNNRGLAVRAYDVMFVHPIIGRTEMEYTWQHRSDPKALSMMVNRATCIDTKRRK